MKKYSTNIIKNYISENKENIDFVACGMREDWLWTEETVYEDGNFSEGFDWDSEYLVVAGIDGSTWATPVMEVCFLDGTSDIIECFLEVEEKVPDHIVSMQKSFALLTGGMDYKF